MEKIIKTRNWIKGHFTIGLFYGLCFGIGLGTMWGFVIAISPWFLITVLLLVAPLIFGIDDWLEEMEFRK